MKKISYSFENRSNEEIVEAFNAQVGVLGWVRARGVYLETLREEFKNRKIDISVVKNESGGFNLNQRVKLDINKRALVLE